MLTVGTQLISCYCNNQFQYLVSDFNEQDEDDDDKQIVNDSDDSDDDVDDLECKVTVSLSARSRMWARYRVWLSSSGVSVVTLFHTSFSSDVFSIAALRYLGQPP